MLVKYLIKLLRAFDDSHFVSVKLVTDDFNNKHFILTDVIWEDGVCKIIIEDEQP